MISKAVVDRYECVVCGFVWVGRLKRGNEKNEFPIRCSNRECRSIKWNRDMQT